MSKICDETYPKTTAALISIVQEIRNLNPDAQIILVGYTNLCRSSPAGAATSTS